MSFYGLLWSLYKELIGAYYEEFIILWTYDPSLKPITLISSQ